jgi:hypothetical protein
MNEKRVTILIVTRFFMPAPGFTAAGYISFSSERTASVSMHRAKSRPVLDLRYWVSDDFESCPLLPPWLHPAPKLVYSVGCGLTPNSSYA